MLVECTVTFVTLQTPLLYFVLEFVCTSKNCDVFSCVRIVRMKLQNLLCDHCLRSRYNQTIFVVFCCQDVYMNIARTVVSLFHPEFQLTGRRKNKLNDRTRVETDTHRRNEKQTKRRSGNEILQLK